MRYTVYFVRSPATGRIKIGMTTCLGLRLSMLKRKGEPEPEVLACQRVGYGRRIEGRVHARLWEHHIANEWFEPHEEVLALASALKWGFVDLNDLPDAVSPLRRNAALRAHAARRARLALEEAA